MLVDVELRESGNEVRIVLVLSEPDVMAKVIPRQKKFIPPKNHHPRGLMGVLPKSVPPSATYKQTEHEQLQGYTFNTTAKVLGKGT